MLKFHLTRTQQKLNQGQKKKKKTHGQTKLAHCGRIHNLNHELTDYLKLTMIDLIC